VLETCKNSGLKKYSMFTPLAFQGPLTGSVEILVIPVREYFKEKVRFWLRRQIH